MNLRRLVIFGIFFATFIGLTSVISGWPKTAYACGGLVIALSLFCIVMDIWVRRYWQKQS